MAENGTSFDIDINTEARGVEEAQSAVEKLAKRLEDAGGAGDKMAADLRTAETAFRAAESTANRAATALEKVGLAMSAEQTKLAKATEVGDQAAVDRITRKLGELATRQTELAAKAAQAQAAMKAEASALDAMKAAAKGADEQQTALGKALAKAKENLKNVQKAEAEAIGSGKVNEMSEAFAKLGGPLGSAGQKAFATADGFKKLLGSLGTGAGPYVAIAIAVVAIATAAFTATAALLSFAVANSDAARTSRLLSDGIAQSAEGGAKLEAKIAGLSRTLPQSREELRSMAADLAKSGLQGQALTDALEAAATKAAQVKFGPNFERAMLSSEKQSEMLKANLAGIFSLNTDKLSGGIGKIIGLLDETSVTGHAIHVVFESLFQPLVDGLANLAPKIVATFIQFEIWVLRALLFLKSIGPQLMVVGEVAKGVAIVIGVAFALVVGAFVAVLAIQALLVAGLYYLVGVIGDLEQKGVAFAKSFLTGPGGAFDYLKTAAQSAIDFLSGISLVQIGAAIVDGLAAGITGGAARVVSSVTDLAGSVVDTAKNVLGIHSPSRVMHDEVGEHIGGGIAGGVDASAGDVQQSITDAVETPDFDAPAGRRGGAGGGGNTYTFVFPNARGSAKEIAAAARAAFDDVLADAAEQFGAGAEVPA